MRPASLLWLLAPLTLTLGAGSSLGVAEAAPSATPSNADPAPWEARAKPLLAGPPGCVEVRGQVEMSLAYVKPGGWLGPGETVKFHLSGPFEGRLEQGTWTRRKADLRSPADEKEVVFEDVIPVVGRLAVHKAADGSVEEGGSLSISMNGKEEPINISAEGAKGVNLVDKILEAINPDMTLSYIEEEADGSVVLVQQSPVRNARGDEMLTMRTRFPKGGAPTLLDVMLPRKVSAGDGLIDINLMDAQVHVRSAETAVGIVPVQEGVSMLIGALGFTVGLDQQIQYTGFRGCT